MGYTIKELDELWLADEPRWVQFAQWTKRDAYIASDANWLIEQVELPALMEPTQHKQTYIEACLAEIRTLRAEVESYRAKLDDHIASLDADIRAHLWVTADFAAPAAKSLEETRHDVETLLARIDKLRQGFEILPIENLDR
jgi:MoxR-like ATPase